ncbi:MAG: type II toxin-antitoxin system RelE/ParE family toxin [Candidatus Omnitrophica bacterium]|nr:type II toxin-antitoxin system RelE/ParE family toxin [Candidatus Omnitrophota bacterium]
MSERFERWWIRCEDITVVLDDIFKGRAVSLGDKLYKIRIAKEGKGKSGGFRSLFFWKRDEFIVFCLLFAKNERDNLNLDEKKVLKILSKEYDNLTENEIQQRIEKKNFLEIRYEKELQ